MIRSGAVCVPAAFVLERGLYIEQFSASTQYLGIFRTMRLAAVPGRTSSLRSKR